MQISVKDQMGREIQFSKTPTRIVSLVPSQTELLVDLGLEKNIVGLTKFCIHPKHLRAAKKIVGGTKTISLEKIKTLAPDIILCNKEENTEEIVTDLEKLYPVHVSYISNLDNSLELIMQYGSLFNCLVQALKICITIKKEAASFQTFIKNKPKINVAYFIWTNPWMAVGNDTFIHYLLNLNNFTNVFGDLERYPKVTKDVLQEKSPDLVLLSSEPFPFKKEHCKEIEELLPKSKIILVDGEYFSWYGSRLQKAFAYFKSLH